MNYDIRRTETFSKHFKDLARKYPAVKADYSNLIDSLQTNPQQGQSLGKNCYKLRMKISGKQAGKSAGARVITYVLMQENKITLLDIYDKSDKENISDKELAELLKQVEE